MKKYFIIIFLFSSINIFSQSERKYFRSSQDLKLSSNCVTSTLTNSFSIIEGGSVNQFFAGFGIRKEAFLSKHSPENPYGMDYSESISFYWPHPSLPINIPVDGEIIAVSSINGYPGEFLATGYVVRGDVKNIMILRVNSLGSIVYCKIVNTVAGNDAVGLDIEDLLFNDPSHNIYGNTAIICGYSTEFSLTKLHTIPILLTFEISTGIVTSFKRVSLINSLPYNPYNGNREVDNGELNAVCKKIVLTDRSTPSSLQCIGNFKFVNRDPGEQCLEDIGSFIFETSLGKLSSSSDINYYYTESEVAINFNSFDLNQLKDRIAIVGNCLNLTWSDNAISKILPTNNNCNNITWPFVGEIPRNLSNVVPYYFKTVYSNLLTACTFGTFKDVSYKDNISLLAVGDEIGSNSFGILANLLPNGSVNSFRRIGQINTFGNYYDFELNSITSYRDGLNFLKHSVASNYLNGSYFIGNSFTINPLVPNSPISVDDCIEDFNSNYTNSNMNFRVENYPLNSLKSMLYFQADPICSLNLILSNLDCINNIESESMITGISVNNDMLKGHEMGVNLNGRYVGRIIIEGEVTNVKNVRMTDNFGRDLNLVINSLSENMIYLISQDVSSGIYFIRIDDLAKTLKIFIE